MATTSNTEPKVDEWDTLASREICGVFNTRQWCQKRVFCVRSSPLGSLLSLLRTKQQRAPSPHVHLLLNNSALGSAHAGQYIPNFQRGPCNYHVRMSNANCGNLPKMEKDTHTRWMCDRPACFRFIWWRVIRTNVVIKYVYTYISMTRNDVNKYFRQNSRRKYTHT